MAVFLFVRGFRVILKQRNPNAVENVNKVENGVGKNTVNPGRK